jgi:DNA-binding beta-propeller fold protein YncE
VWHPRTANAAAELAAGTMYITDANMGNGTFTVIHANNAQTDRDFRYAVVG